MGPFQLNRTPLAETIMDPCRFLMGPFQLNRILDSETFPDETEHTSRTVTNNSTADAHIPNKRPRRAAAITAEQRVVDVLRWEKCKESSKMFKHVDTLINTEFDRVARGAHRRVGGTVHMPVSTPQNVDAPQNVDVGVAAPPIPIDPKVGGDMSDDEGAADVDCPILDMYNDNDDDLDNDDDDEGSLVSFVVSDSHISDTGNMSDPESVHDESESDSDSDGSFPCTDTVSECNEMLQCNWSDDEKM
jgi:hypothetical protein